MMIMMMDSNVRPPTSTPPPTVAASHQNVDHQNEQRASVAIVSNSAISALDTDDDDADSLSTTGPEFRNTSIGVDDDVGGNLTETVDEQSPIGRFDAQTLEKLAKIFSCLVPGSSGDSMDSNPQLFAAMAATQEQLFTNMAMNMFANNSSADSQSAVSSNDEDNSPRSKKRRKQSKPVRYESHVLPDDASVDDKCGTTNNMTEQETFNRKMSSPNITTKQHISVLDKQHRLLLKRKESLMEAAPDEDCGTVTAATGHDIRLGGSGDCGNGGPGGENGDDRYEMDDVVEDGDIRIRHSDVEDEENSSEEVSIREKQLLLQQTMENMFANLQQKLIQSCFCPQCNCPFVNEDQLRAHIEFEHMQKLQFFPPHPPPPPPQQQAPQPSATAASIASSTTAPQTSSTLSTSPTSPPLPTSASLSANSNQISANYELHKIAQQLAAAQQKFQEQMQLHKRKRKRSRTPSSGDGSSGNSSNDDDSSMEQKSVNRGDCSPSLDVNEDSGKVAKSSHHPHHLSSSKDLNHNLLAHLPPSFINPLISLTSKTPPTTQTSSSNEHSLNLKISTEPSQSQSPGVVTSHPPPSLFPSTMAPFLYPMLSGGQGGHQFPTPSSMINGVSVPVNAVSGMRIFNPEAYCELCNKEFCNKYFLKTHKANKHGIYTEGGPPVSQNSSSTSGGHSMTTTSTSTTTNSNTSSPFYLSATSSAISSHTSTNPTVNKLLSTSPPLMSGAGVAPFTPPMRLNLNMNVINLDSYCEFCQKEFCNKYFLKKHKQKIHGFVYQGDTPIPPSHNTAQLHQLQQLQMLQQQLVAQQQMANSQSNSGSVADSGVLNASSSVPSPSPSGHNSAVHQDKSHSMNISSTGTSVNTPPTTSTITTNNTTPSSSIENTAMSTATIAFSADKLRQMGVINADAFCEICCKEFCNKYFLRTHKVNKHGIVDGQTIPAKFNATCSLVSPNSSTMPTTFTTSPTITTANNGTCVSTNFAFNSNTVNGNSEELEPGQRDPSSYANNGDDFLKSFSTTNTTSTNNSNLTVGFKCELCPQQFPSNHLLKMHQLYLHNIPYNKQIEPEKAKAESVKEEDDDCSTKGDKSEKCNKGDNDDSDVESEITSMPHMMVSAELANEAANCQELQKLHSMIKDLIPTIGLNECDDDQRASDTSDPKCVCHLCKFECDNRYFLRAHLINDHGFPPNEEAFAQMINSTNPIDPMTMKNILESGRLPFPLSGAIGESSEAFCDICNKEFCSKYFLKTHRQNIHGIYDSGSGNSPLSHCDQSQPSANNSPSIIPPALLTSLYQRAKNQAEIESLNQALNQAAAMSKAHSNSKLNNNSVSNSSMSSPLKAAIAAGLVPPPSESKPRMPPIVTGRNYCNLCNKELCNKYFMKTHMLKMHGINIDEHPIEAASTSTIGGVTCDICQKELCSKYFLKVHKQNTHGIYEDGNPPVMLGSSFGPQSGPPNCKMMMPSPFNPMQSGNHDINPLLLMSMANTNHAATTEVNSAASDSNSVCSSNSDKLDAKQHGIESNDTTNRYFNTYQEVCQICDRRFKSIKWLKSHMINDHSEILAMMRSNNDITQAIAQSTGANVEQLSRLCFVCGQMFADRVEMNFHLVKEHKTTTEELAMNLAGNIKIAALMAAAAAAAEQSNVTDLSMKDEENRRSPNSLPSSPYYPSSPKEKSTSDEDPNRQRPSSANTPASPPMFNNMALQNLMFKNSSLALAAAAAAAVAGNENPALTNRWMSTLFGGDNYPSRSESPMDMPLKPTSASKVNKFTCQVCSRSYRHSHSLQRHMLCHKQSPTPKKTPSDDGAPVKSKGENVSGNNGNSEELTANKPRNKRYRCSKCNKKFRTRELCLVHIRALHPSVKTSPNKDNEQTIASTPTTNSCSICGSSFTTLAQLKMHISKIHNNFQPEKKFQAESQMSDIPLNLRSSDHLLPPSPSASSDEDGHLVSNENSKNNSIQLPQSPVEETDSEMPQNLTFKCVEDTPMDTGDPNESVPTSDTNTITRPSLICVNGEQY